MDQIPKHPVPRHRIPNTPISCPYCDRGVRTKISSPFADGYHRRHECRHCQATFYSLSSYHSTDVQMAKVPFKDRPLTHREMEERDRWWDEVNVAVTSPGNTVASSTAFFNTMMERLNIAVATKKEHRNPQQEFMAELFDSMKQSVIEMDEGELSDDALGNDS